MKWNLHLVTIRICNLQTPICSPLPPPPLSEKESSGCGRGGTCNWLTFILGVALILSLSAVIALVAEGLIHGCFRTGNGGGGGGGGGGGRGGAIMRSANAPGVGGSDIGTDIKKMFIERKIDEESAMREKKVRT